MAKENRSNGPLWLDIETAAELLGKSKSQVWRVAQKLWGRGRKGRVNFHDLLDHFAA